MEKLCRTQRSVDMAIKRGDVVVIDSTYKGALVTINEGRPTLIVKSGSPRIVTRDTSAPRIVTYGTSSPSIVTYGTSAPRIVTRETSAPRIETRHTSAPSIETYEASAPRIETRHTSAPRIETRDTSAPSIVTYDTSAPRIVTWDTSAPRIVTRGASSPRIVTYETSAPSIETWDTSAPSIVTWDTSAPLINASGFSVVRCLTPSIKVLATGQAHVVNPQWPTDPAEWAAMYGLVPVDGVLRLWKTTNVDGLAFRDLRTEYVVGRESVATDWGPNYNRECGCGLHLGPNPSSARSFVAHDTPYRLFSVLAKLEDIRCYGPYPDFPHKCRARACVVEAEWPTDYDGDGTTGPEANV
jgi:hypothetical protein